MRFRLLGELDVEGERGQVTIAAPKQRGLLALLLLRRGRPVPVDQIADDLWGGDPPAGAVKTVQVYVAQLRKVLDDGVLLTRGGGYVVDLEGHELDIDRFEDAVVEGRRLLAAGDTGAAASVLREALGLWRGAALADFAYEEFAQAEIARLEEERLGALELRIDADLELGAEAGLVAEIAALFHEHPLRERLAGQLMVALYRNGRQAEALEVYRTARETLLNELGLEPSPALQQLERAILEQDESLGPVRPVVAGRGHARRGGRLVLAGGALVLAASAAAVAVALTRGERAEIALPLPPNSVAALDPDSGRVTADLPVGAGPAALSIGESGVWVLSADDRTVSRVEPESNSVRTIGVGALPTDIAVGEGSVWIGTGGRFDRSTFAGWTATGIVQMNGRTGAIEQTLSLPRASAFVSNAAAQHLAVSRGHVWAIAPDARLVRIDPRTGTVKAIDTHSVPIAVAADPRSVWVLNDDATLFRIGRDDSVTARVRVPALGLNALAVSGTSVWATSPDGGVVWRIDPGPRAVARTVATGLGSDSVAIGAGHVWVGNSASGTLSRIDPATNRVDLTIPLGNSPTAVAVGGGRVWVAVAGGPAAAATTSRLGGVEPLPGTFCSDAVAGDEPPRFLVVSDLPLQGGPRFPTAQMSDAVRFVLRAHGFRAGKYALAYQSCDDSTARTGLFDFAKCSANAHTYVANPAVIGVVGPYNSGCAFAQLPVANRAQLPIVSPTASDVGLSRRAPGAPPGALRSLFPTGVRTFARVIAADDVQAEAMAAFARGRGLKRLYVLDDGGFGTLYSFYFRRAAERLGLDVSGFTSWNPKHLAPDALAARVAAARPDAVYICGLTDTGAGAVVAAVRKATGPRTPLLGCSALLPSALLFREAGEAARGIYVSLETLPAPSLGTKARSFLHDFATTQAGRPIADVAVYAAQATEVLLAAIARSDGTRASVARELLKFRTGSSLLGSFRIAATGDAMPARTAIVRLDAPGRSNAVQSYDGARVIAVVAP